MIDEKNFMQFMTALEESGAEYVSFDDLRKFIDKEPKVGEWIPCSERLPDPKIEVMVTLRNCKYVFSGYKTEPTEETESCFYVDGQGLKTIENVLAWQPLPEPYREDKK